MEIEMKRGDVFYLKCDDSVGRELATGRPVVVLSNTREIMNNDCVVVAMLTNTPRKGIVKVVLKDHITYVNVGQIRTVDKCRLNTYMDTLSNEEMKKISGKLRYILSLVGTSENIAENTGLSKTKSEEPIEQSDKKLYRDLYEKAIELLLKTKLELEQAKAGTR